MRKKVGLALGGGAARGLAHIGVLKILKENKIPIDFIAGTSMGALVGATFAAGLDIKQIEEIACNTDWKLTARLFLPTLSRSGFIEGRRIKDFVRALVSDSDIDALKIPFAAVATDLLTGEEIIIHKGSLVEAVRASISIPVIFTPICYQNRFLVDGGLVNPVPTSVVAKMGADVVIAVNVIPKTVTRSQKIKFKKEKKRSFKQKSTSSRIFANRLSNYVRKVKKGGVVAKTNSLFNNDDKAETEFRTPNLVNIVMQTVYIAENEIFSLRLKQEKPDILIQPEIDSMGLLEFYRAKEAIRKGEEATIKLLPLIEKAVR